MTDRRTFLTAAGAAAVAGLTGCTPPNQPADRAAGAVEIPIADVPVGGGTILNSGRYVVTQPTAGVFKAFNKTCTHQGCPVSDIEAGAIHCRCHGARFSIADGTVAQGPATRPLAAASVEVVGDTLKVSGG